MFIKLLIELRGDHKIDSNSKILTKPKKIKIRRILFMNMEFQKIYKDVFGDPVSSTKINISSS